MEQFAVRFLPDGTSQTVDRGTTLLQAMRSAGLVPDAPCGGKGTCGKCRVAADGRDVLACQTTVDRDMTVTLPLDPEKQILTQGLGADIRPDGSYGYAMAFDIGTTTLAACLMDGKTGAVLALESCPNPQISYGADVISRIRYALSDEGQILRRCIRDALHRLAFSLTEQAGIRPETVGVASVAGNTAMHHLLLGIDPGPLVTPPYMPAICDALELPARELLPIGGSIRVLPNIAGFVGGDMAGCMVAADFDRLEELTLLLDIGTNGEMVLGDRNRQIACSAAAGPAFEGAKISCGMCAALGAVDRVWVEDGTVRFHTVGEGPAVGICGSGLLDLVASLLEIGVIDESGYMAAERYQLGDTAVMLTRRDIREVQLAKAAIRAGIELLAQELHVALQDIRRVLLAGAFGNYLNPESACRIGMIPSCLEDRIVPIGNAACEGAKRCALCYEAFQRSRTMAGQVEYLELASSARFEDVFVDALCF